MEPVGVYRTKSGKGYTYLRSCEVIKIVREACVRAYPDPNHFLRINITRLVAHSARVTAAMALWAKGWPIPKIAARIRWSEESVRHYLREAHSQIDAMTADAAFGATIL